MKDHDEPALERLARLIAGAAAGTRLASPPPELVPATAADAFRVQSRVLALLGTAAGAWKVGAKSPDAPIQGAPIPATRVLPDGARLAAADFHPLGLELEIAFVLGRAFPARTQPYSTDEVLAGVSTLRAAIEIVASRFAAWPRVPPLLQLADLQNNGALVLGDAVPYDPGFPFERPDASLRHGGHEVAKMPAANPAGDPRRLLAWLVNHRLASGEAVEAGSVITTGTFTGLHVSRDAAHVCGRIAGLPAVHLDIA